jgi:hypothetical protein
MIFANHARILKAFQIWTTILIVSTNKIAARHLYSPEMFAGQGKIISRRAEGHRRAGGATGDLSGDDFADFILRPNG